MSLFCTGLPFYLMDQSEDQLHMIEAEEPSSENQSISTTKHQLLRLNRWKWIVLVTLNVALLLIGQAVAVILGKFYFDQGGNSKWMATLVQTAAFPVLYLPLSLFPSLKTHPNTPNHPSIFRLTLVYLFLGLLLAGDNMLYSIGLWKLPVSTYSLICATQLAFTAIISFFINAQKLTHLILNSVVLLSLSASLVSVQSKTSSGTKPETGSEREAVVGLVSTIAASAAYSLLLSLMQLSFDKVLKKETFFVVLEMQIYTSLVASCVCLVGLFASGEGMRLKSDMEGFEKGKVSYVMTLIGTALAWQVCSVGVVGLIFLVSSLFSNAVSMLSLPFVPVVSVIFYNDAFDGVKVVAILLTIWGFGSYLYQQYLDDKEHRPNEVAFSLRHDESRLQIQSIVG